MTASDEFNNYYRKGVRPTSHVRPTLENRPPDFERDEYINTLINTVLVLLLNDLGFDLRFAFKRFHIYRKKWFDIGPRDIWGLSCVLLISTYLLEVSHWLYDSHYCTAILLQLLPLIILTVCAVWCYRPATAAYPPSILQPFFYSANFVLPSTVADTFLNMCGWFKVNDCRCELVGR